jgi:archaemetzincin
MGQRIYLVPFPGVESEVLDVIDRCVREGFGVATGRFPGPPPPSEAFVAARRQHDSATLLRVLVGLAPADALKVLGVAREDLGTPVLSFVFGQAQLDGPAAVISLHRLRQEFHRLPPSAELLRARACKEARHELGHTFGLVHCADRACAMSLSTTVRDVDEKRQEFCAACGEQLRAVIRGPTREGSGSTGPMEER